MPNDDNGVVFRVTVDDSTVERDMRSASERITRAAERTQNAVSRASDEAESSLDDMSDAADDAAESMDDLGDAADDASDDLDGLGESSENAAKKTEKLKDSVGKLKSSFKEARDTIGKYAAASAGAITAIGTAAAKSAADAETAFAKVKTLLSEGVNTADYYNSIKAASANTGIGFSDMAESVYSAISASVDENKAVDFAQNAVKLAKGGFTETATAVDVLTTAINAYGLAADDASHISDVLISTQNLGKTTVDELAHSMGQTIPIANSAGVAIEELSTAYAVMTKNGVATAEAGTQIKAMLNELNASGTNVDKTLRQVTGKSFAQLKAEGQTTADVLNTLSGYAKSSGKSLSDLFGSVEAGAAALTLVKDGGADFTNILDQMKSSAGAAEKAYETMADTVSERLNKLKNKFTLALANIGEELLPYIEKFADYIDDHFDEISKTIGEIGKSVEQAAEFLLGLTKALWENRNAVAAAVAGFVAFKTAMAIGNVISSVVGAIKSLKLAIESATTAQEIMNGVCNMNPYVLLASAVIGVVTALGTFAVAAHNSAVDVDQLADKVHGLAEESKNAVAEQRDLENVVSEYMRINANVSDAKQKKEELAKLQETLNGLYDEEKTKLDLVNGSYEENIEALKKLNEEEKTRAKAEIELAMREADKAISDVGSHQVSLKFDWKGANAEFEQEFNELFKKFEERGAAALVGNTGGDNRNVLISGNFYNQLSVLKEMKKVMEQSGATNGDYAETYIQICDEVDKLNKLLDGTNSLIDSLFELDKQTEKVSATATDAGEVAADETVQLEEQQDAVKSLIDEYGGLYDALKTLQKGGALSYEQMQELIKIYPELADKIHLTGDGYIAEQNALGMLENALDSSVAAQIEAEREKTAAAIEGARDRIAVLQTEASALASMGKMTGDESRRIGGEISEQMSKINSLEQKLSTYDSLSAYLKSGRGKSGGSSGSGGGSSSSGSGGRSTNGKGGNADNETKFDNARKNLDHQKNMGRLTDEQYYSSLRGLMNSYLEPGSDKYNSVEERLHAYEESVKKSDAEKPVREFERLKDDKKFALDMHDITEDEYYKWLEETHGQYLEKGTDDWKSVQREIQSYKDSKKKSTGTSASKDLGSSGSVISIDSYIPTVWDSDAEADKKLQAALGLELAGNSNYSHNIKDMQNSAAAVGSTVSSAPADSVSAKDATLSDILNAISDLKKAEEHRKISFEAEIKARDLTIGTVAYKDINDITKMTGKSPLIKGSE